MIAKRPIAILLILFFLTTHDISAQTDTRGLDVVARNLGVDSGAIGRQIAVFIAIDKYKEWIPLKNPVKDASEIAAILSSRYVVDETIELYDEKATRMGILDLFERLIASTKPEDSIFIYYAGHGHFDTLTETGSWIPQDGGTDTRAQINWLGNIQIRNMIGKFKARHVVLIADACFSGDILDTSRAATPTINDEYFRRAYALVSRQVITSGASETVPDQSSFSRALKMALEGNRRPYLDPLAIFEAVRLGVKGTSPLLGILTDHQEGGSFLLFLKSQPAAAATAVAVPAAKPVGEIMVATSVAGAEVYVNGELRGTAPIVIQKVPAGEVIQVEVRKGSMGATTSVSLQPGQLLELNLQLEQLKGNLFIPTAESGLTVYVDGTLYGPLGSGLLRDLPAGSHTVELKGSGLYYSSKISIPSNETLTIEAKPAVVGALAISAPTDVTTIIKGQGLSLTQIGTGTLDPLPVGRYELVSTGVGYAEVRSTLTVDKASTASYAPFTSGSLRFGEVASGTVFSLDGGLSWSPVKALVDGVAPDSYTISIAKPGYRTRDGAIQVAAGKQIPVDGRLERLAAARARVRISAVPIAVSYRESGESTWHAVAQSGNEPGFVLFDLPSGIPLEYRLQSEAADSLFSDARTLNLKERETADLPVPVGRIILPWIPGTPTLTVGKGIAITGSSRPDGSFETDNLPAGRYTLCVGGERPWTGIVEVRAGMTSEPAGYRDAMIASLTQSRDEATRTIESVKARRTGGWVSLTTGLIGAAGAGLSYYLATVALDEYYAADSASAPAAWSKVELFYTILPISMGVGGVGLGLSPIFLFGGQSAQSLQAIIDSFDEQIRALERK